MDIREYLQREKLVFDGAMGTYYASLYGNDESCELAAVSHPDRIFEIHDKYISAGAKAIKTDTFAANTSVIGDFKAVGKIIKNAWTIATKASKQNTFVFANIGYIEGENSADEYIRIVDKFLSLGAKHFLFETLPSIAGARKAAKYIKKSSPEAFIIISVASSPDGFTRTGESAEALISELDSDSNVDALGLNCVSGPAHLLKLVERIGSTEKPMSVMPNSGYPTIVGGRTYYPESAEYFAEILSKIAGRASIVGGCCGTTPEHIEKVVKLIGESAKSVDIQSSQKSAKVTEKQGSFLEKLKAGKKVIAVELDPPLQPDIEPFLKGAEALMKKNVDAVTIADCPVARVRADSSMVAAKLKRELGIDTIPHMTCRDRNINATKALLLGLGIEGVENVLVVTGDPVPNESRDEIKAVFSFNSAVLAKYIKLLGEQTGKHFAVGGALNVNAPNFAAELKKAQRKEEAGVDFLLTQPIFSHRAIENLRLAHKTLGVYILGGIIPIVSYRNAKFMQNEMAGIDIPNELAERYIDLEREEAEKLAISLSIKTAQKIRDICDGYYLITPFGRVGLINKIINGIRDFDKRAK